jgi:hypothetical protein
MLNHTLKVRLLSHFNAVFSLPLKKHFVLKKTLLTMILSYIELYENKKNDQITKSW